MTKRSDHLARLTANLQRVTAKGPHDWYRIEAKADEPAEVWIYDEIGWYGTSAGDFARDLAAVTSSTINLHLNSPGGSVFDGVAIHNSLRAHKATVNVTVDGIAASIASVIAMAGDTVTMGRGTEMMIHNPSGIVLGNAVDMREMADLLDRLALDLAGFYHERAGGTLASWSAAMDAETWYSAQEAVDAGLADSVIGDDPPAARAGVKTPPGPNGPHDLSAYRYAGRERAPGPIARHVQESRRILAAASQRRNAR